jgi:RimJ/RimL family protein N-acetyltransferase
MSFVEITTPRLVLRPFRDEDFAAMLPYHSDPEVVRYIPWPVRDETMVRTALTEAMARTRFEEEGDYLSLAVVRVADEQLVGQVNAMYRSKEHESAEFGYVINPAFARQGYGAEASRALVTALFLTGKFHRVFAKLDARNLASKKLLEAIGFREEAFLHEDYFFKGEWTSSYEFATLKDEWLSANA